MRIRTIKPQFFMNEELVRADTAGGLLRLFFIGLWCASDGLGRCEDRPSRLKAEILPYEDVEVESLLDVLAQHDWIRRYEVGGKKLIQVTTFSVHQRITGKEAQAGSKYEPPPDGWKPPEKKTGGHAPRTRGLRVYEEDAARHGPDHADLNHGGDKGTGRANNFKCKAARVIDEVLIYEAYPRKCGKPAALTKIRKALKTVSFDRLLERTKAFAQAVAGSDPQFIPHPSTWFNQERYNDDPTTWTRAETGRVQDPGRNPNLGLAGAEVDTYGDIGRSLGIPSGQNEGSPCGGTIETPPAEDPGVSAAECPPDP